MGRAAMWQNTYWHAHGHAVFVRRQHACMHAWDYKQTRKAGTRGRSSSCCWLGESEVDIWRNGGKRVLKYRSIGVSMDIIVSIVYGCWYCWWWCGRLSWCDEMVAFIKTLFHDDDIDMCQRWNEWHSNRVCRCMFMYSKFIHRYLHSWILRYC